MDAHLESECLFCRIATGAIRGPNRIVEFPNSVAILHFNQTYRGRSILVAKPHCTDMLELDAPTFAALGEELRRLAQALRVTLEAERINCANFGNACRICIGNVIPRRVGDHCWGGSPSFASERSFAEDEEFGRLAALIRAGIGAIMPPWPCPDTARYRP